jgi:hypothetical protein
MPVATIEVQVKDGEFDTKEARRDFIRGLARKVSTEGEVWAATVGEAAQEQYRDGDPR